MEGLSEVKNKETSAYVGEYHHPLPDGPHAAYNHDSTNDADTLVLGHSAGELFADHYVHVVLRGEVITVIRSFSLLLLVIVIPSHKYCIYTNIHFFKYRNGHDKIF